MIVKKFEARTETEAVMRAKEDLGAQAVVLNVKTIKQRGIFRLFRRDKVEITAALEEREFVQEINEKKPVLENKPKGKIDLRADEKIDVIPSSDEIERKLDNLSEMLKSRIKENTEEKLADKMEDNTFNDETDDPRQRAMNNNIKTLRLVYNKLIDNEVDEKYANDIVNEIENSLKKESNIDSILAGVYQKIILKLGEADTIKIGDTRKVVFFVGPTGVGKTTTIAKIASKYKLNEHKKVAFITSDTFRIAAVEQLNTYANILDVPVRVVYTDDELINALDEFKNYDLILVDTTGRSHKNKEQRINITNLYNSVKKEGRDMESEIYLVLSVTTKYKDLISITKAYEKLGDYKLLFTKLDETGALGNILNIKLRTGAHLSYTTAGQNVPDDIEVINVQKLAKQLLGGKV